MDIEMEIIDRSRCRELAMSSSFCRRIYSEIEEVGWENLVRLGNDLTFLCFRVMDSKGRQHILEITLDETYPRRPPSVSVGLPYNFNLEWFPKSKLRDVVQQFQRHVDQLHDFSTTMDDIDRFLVTEPINSHHAASSRHIKIGHDCYVVVSINVDDPLSLPECRFLGSDAAVNTLMKMWKRNSKRWDRGKPFPENFEHVFDSPSLQQPCAEKNKEQVECGICYSQYLPIDDELGAKSGSATDYTCENAHCNRAFHTICLVDWLRSITTTRRSFDVLFGNCPYCSDPVAVKLGMK
ncbi:uncharacterized protein LOC127258592 isoform X2 [Andrographis paniculata]|uniref:uncharacterized protein LOC127258592 isoform X2 n=2 Tax=Andrographis paniculata TaxID=175694 RepID=UPI0021E9246B|nr:uncharacterized protein LOC127258592 isoform X2 [Andrographis paniculata]